MAAKKQSVKRKPALWVQIRNKRLKPAMKVRRGIRRRSQKMTKFMQEYNHRKKLFLAKPENRYCFATLRFRNAVGIYEHSSTLPLATEVHHRNGRAASLLLDERFWIPVSEDGHRGIHERPALARELGLLCKLGEWNKPVDK